MLLAASCVAALLHLSCGDGDTNGTEHVTVGTDAGPGPSSDGSTDTGNGFGECEPEGFKLRGPTSITEHEDFWHVEALSEYGNYYVDIFIYSPYIASDDRFEFGTVDGEPSDHLLVISKMCPDDQWCDTFFNATSGAFDIISRTDPSTSNYLTGHIVDAELVEGALDANGRFQRTAGGEIMCVERASLQGSMDAL